MCDLIISCIQVMSGMGTYAGAARRRVHLAAVLLRPPSGYRPGCLDDVLEDGRTSRRCTQHISPIGYEFPWIQSEPYRTIDSAPQITDFGANFLGRIGANYLGRGHDVLVARPGLSSQVQPIKQTLGGQHFCIAPTTQNTPPPDLCCYMVSPIGRKGVPRVLCHFLQALRRAAVLKALPRSGWKGGGASRAFQLKFQVMENTSFRDKED